MQKTFILVFMAMVLLALMTSAARAEDDLYHTPPHCWDGPRIFHSRGADHERFDEAIAKHIRITRAIARFPDDDLVPSPNGSYRFSIEEKKVDGTIEFFILVYSERPYLLQHAIVSVREVQDVKWVNEKTLYYRVWFGSVGGVDVLYDVELEEVIRYQPFYEGSEAYEQFLQCHEPDNAVPETCVSCPWERRE